MLVLERGKACAYTRNGHDWSDRYSGILRAAVKHPCRAAILDGAVIVPCATISWWNAERSCKLFSVATLKVRFNSAKSSSGMPQPSSAPVPRMSWNASSPNSQPLATAAVEARPGSRPSALPKANSSCLASTVTARPEPRVRFLPSQSVVSLSMQDQLSSRFVQQHARSSAPGSPNSNKNVRCFLGCGIEMHIGSDPNSHLR